MSDVYIPGVKSRFNSEKTIEDLMKLEKVPRDRVQRNVDTLQVQKGYWQEVGRRINSLRDSSRFLFSFQNPFNERIGQSTDENVITATATREAAEQSFHFTVKQVATADRFLSQPLEERAKIEPGNYVFTVGKDEIAINFRGGTLNDFVEIINRRGRDKIRASLIAVQTGTRSLLIEAKDTGSANRLGFLGDARVLATKIGMMEVSNDTQKNINITESTVKKEGPNASNISINEGVLKVAPRSSASLPINLEIASDSPLVLRLETQTRTESVAPFVPQTPPGPSIPTGNVTYGGITILNDPSSSPLPDLTQAAPPERNDDMGVLKLTFSDGSSAKLPAISDSSAFTARQYNLAEFARGKTIVSLNVENANTHREVSVGKVDVLDPNSTSGGLKPVNAVSTSKDAIITMEGIEIVRQNNNIDDLIPGVTLNLKGASDKPVELKVTGNTDAIKEAIINFVGNYNRLMAEINVLTSTRGNTTPDMPRATVRGDERIIDELTYLSADEVAQMKERLGAFNGDSTLINLKNNLQRAVTAPYPTSLDRDLALLAQIGISSNASRSTGYDVSRLRGYLEINEKTLDAALETRIPAIRELFGNDTSGDLLADTGVAFNVDTITNPFIQTGGIISLKSNTIDSRINQDEKRIANLDRQLAVKEQELRMQYAKMESAYARMEQMSSSLDNFSRQNSGNNR